MTQSRQHILVVNGGSSGIKFALFQIGNDPQRLLFGSMKRIGHADASLRVQGVRASDDSIQPLAGMDHAQAVAVLIEHMQARSGAGTLAAIGHRVVHGGSRYSAPQRINPIVISDLRQLLPLDPEHLPVTIALIEALQSQFPDVPQVACFDTAFHHQLPSVAQWLPIPRRYQAQGMRRYGFHGLSYEFLLAELARLAGPEAAHGRVILAHLGHGASLAAVRGGKCMDTSMGFTPASGLVMGTRSGDIDPGLPSYLATTGQMSTAQFQHMVNRESGLLGISETSSDMGELLGQEMQDTRAAEAIALFCYQARKWIGAMAAVLGGVDTLVFAGGIGENAPVIRERICSGLEFLGITLDTQRNDGGFPLISADHGRTQVRVIATNEELLIARSVCRVLDLASSEELSP